MTRKIPRDALPDSTLAFAMRGYTFISQRCRRYRSDLFQTRLLFQKTICMLGEEAATIFYDNDRFERKGAAPPRLQATLVGRGGVQGLDGETHRRRKEMFMSLMTPGGIERLAEMSAAQWRAYGAKWQRMREVVLLHEAREILCRAVCAWAGVPLDEAEVKRRTGELAAMIDAAGGLGLRYWRGRQARKRAEKWIGALVEDVRNQKRATDEGSALHVIAWHRTSDGELLDIHTAAVEVLNVLRPTVAIARFIVFGALALHQHPQCREKIRAVKDDYLQLFVQEVRRFYPFFPAVAARVRTDFEWKGYAFPKGVHAILDLYGTDHDARIWERPEEFRPERFREWNGSAFNFIPQGGGDHFAGHRCAGEWITIELMKGALQFLSRSIEYDVPKQDLRVSLSRMPTMPKSEFVMTKVRDAMKTMRNE